MCPVLVLNELERGDAVQHHCQQVTLSHSFYAEDDEGLGAMNVNSQPDYMALTVERKLSHIDQAVPHVPQHREAAQQVETVRGINHK